MGYTGPVRALMNTGRHLDIYAHRGSTILAPENTTAAFELALAYGADVLEIDVRLSRDGHVVVTHDATVDRTSNGHGRVDRLSLTELKRLDAAHRFTDPAGKHYRKQGIQFITLDEMFELFPTSRINIDIKDNAPEAAKAVATAIEKAGSQSLVNVGSFHSSALEHFRQQAPDVTTAATQSEVARLYFGGEFKPPARYQYLQIPLNYLGIPLTPAWFIKKARQLEIQTVYWTINDVGTMNKLIAKGVSGLVTDRIDLACQLRESINS